MHLFKRVLHIFVHMKEDERRNTDSICSQVVQMHTSVDCGFKWQCVGGNI